jgi:hypothetical protein
MKADQTNLLNLWRKEANYIWEACDMRKRILVTVASSLLFVASAFANPVSVVVPDGDLVISEMGSGLVFPDKTTQYTAAVSGGTVTSVGSGEGLAGGPITGSGTISIAPGGIVNSMLADTLLLPIANGGTGGATASAALSGLGGVNKAGDTMSGNLSLPSLTMTGNLTLPATTATAGIINSGSNTLIHTYGTNNFFAGINAGNLTTTGNGNTATGMSALHSNTTGSYNTASGYYALYSNTTGNSNTASGLNTLFSNTTGSNNTANGYYALYSNTTGNSNTASGVNALIANTTGSNNTATGLNALASNTTGYNNTASGYFALYSNSTGYSNTASGSGALNSNTTGNSNTASGCFALYLNTTGSYNTASGLGALSSNTTGDDNTVSGYYALTSNTTGYSNTASGVNALHENTTGYNNTTSGLNALFSNTTGNGNTASGYKALYANTTGSYNTALGINAGGEYTTGAYNTFIGNGSDAELEGLTNATAIGSGAIVDASDHVRIGNTSVKQIGGAVPWSSLSDIRIKKDIENIGYGLDFVKALRPVQYRMKNGDDRTDFGFIAQEIEGLIGSGYNILGIGGDTERMLSLRYTDFIAPLVKAVQEQQTIIESQKEIIRTFEERLSRLEAMMKLK